MESLAQKWMNAGIEKGIEKGVEKGVAAQRQTLLHLACWRLALPVEAEQHYAQQLAQIHNLDHLVQLVNQLLTLETVAEFDKALLAYLPPTGVSQ